MKKYQEVEEKITRIIEKSKLPNGVKQIISEIYMQYKDACDSCIEKLKLLGNSEKSAQTIQCIKENYEEDVRTINAAIDGAYAIKGETQTNDIIKQLQYILGEKQTSLDAILFDTTEQEKFYNKNKDKIKVEDIINNRRNNEDFIERIEKEIVSELKSTKKNILQKIQSCNAPKQEMEKSLLINRIKEVYTEDMDRVLQDIQRNFSEVGKALEGQDKENYEQIILVIEEYKEKEEESFEEQRKKFVENNRQGVNVDEEQAKETANEKQYNQSLDAIIK